MNLPSPYRYTSLTAADARRLWEFEHWTFPTSTSLDQASRVPYPVAPENMRAVIAGPVVADAPSGAAVDGPAADDLAAEIVASYGSHPFTNFPVPGGTAPTGGLTNVGVHPAHRRRGLLRALIADHFTETAQRGSVLSALYAAEPTIYGRFGYGVAARDVRVTIPRASALRPQVSSATAPQNNAAPDDAPPLTIRIESRTAAHNSVINELHLAAGRNVAGTGLNRPGWATRESAELRNFWHDPNLPEPGEEPQRIVIVERAGQPVGYSVIRRKSQWAPTGPTGEVSAGEVVALDPPASRRLWEVILDLDLTSRTTAFMIPTDDPIVNLLENVRGIAPTVVDNLWLRIIDLPAALAARQYQGNLDLTLEVTDSLLPQNAGVWRLTASAFGSATVAPAEKPAGIPADLALDIRTLASAYLGDASLGELAAAGLVQVNRPAVLGSASAAFGWPHKPVCSWVF